MRALGVRPVVQSLQQPLHQRLASFYLADLLVQQLLSDAAFDPVTGQFHRQRRSHPARSAQGRRQPSHQRRRSVQVAHAQTRRYRLAQAADQDAALWRAVAQRQRPVLKQNSVRLVLDNK
ncbi:hypothetical protein D9M70_531860 [compost metagenome]